MTRDRSGPGTPPFGRAHPGDSVLHRRDPTVKLATLFVVSMAVLVPVDPWTPSLLYALAVPAVVLAGRLPWGLVLARQAVFAPFALSLLSVNAVTRPGGEVVDLLGLTVTDVGLSVGVSLAVRTLLVGTLSLGFVLTTDGARLMTSLHRHARLSPRAVFAVLAGYRVLEQLPERWRTIRRAQAVREPLVRAAGVLPRSPGALGRAAFALLVTTIRQGERMAASMETRGLGSGPRTVARPIGLGRHDLTLALVPLGVTAATLVLADAGGWLRTWATLG